MVIAHLTEQQTFWKYPSSVDLPAPTLPSTLMVKGRPEALWSSSSAEGKGMKRLAGAAREKPAVILLLSES